MQLVRLEAERNQDSGGITPQRAPGRRRPRRLSGSGIPRLVEERHVGVVQELHFGTVADQGLGLFGQLIGYRHAFLISTAMAVQCDHRLVLPAVYAGHAHRLAAVYGHRELCARRHPIIVGKPVGHAGAWLFPEIGVSLSPVAREGNTCGHSLVGKAQPCQG